MVGGGQARGPRAYHQHPLTRRRRRDGNLPAVPDCLVAEESLDRVDAHRAVELRAVARGLTRPVADPAHDRGERVVLHELPPCRLIASRAGFGVVEPLLDVLAGRARVVARWQQVAVYRSLGPPCAGVVGAAGAHIQRDGEWLVHGVSPNLSMLRSAMAWILAMVSVRSAGRNRCA